MERKIPKIRFKGFTDDWEQRKLGEISSSFEYGLNAAAKEYDGENKYIRITDIDDNTHEFLPDSLTSPDIDLTGAENYKLVKGDILFARTGASVGKSYIYRDYDGLVYYAGFLIRAKIKDEYDAEFVFQNTLTDKYNKYIAVTSQRSGQPGVNAQEYSEFEIQVPKKEEQIKIGNYFRNLDNLITLHQRKCEKLKDIKEILLEQMFPQKGEKTPRIRFKGFTDDWEQRKLNEIATYHSSNLTASDANEVGKFDLYDANSVIGKTDVEPISAEYITVIKDGAGVGRIRKMPPNTMFIGTMGGLKANRSDVNFIYSMLTRFDLGKEYSGSTIPHIYFKDYGNNDYFIPSEKEQKIIGQYFATLDNLITLHQRKCEKLKDIKEILLEQMFV